MIGRATTGSTFFGNEIRRLTSLRTMMPLQIFSQRIYIVASISVALAVLAGVLLYQARAPLANALGYNSVARSVSPNTVYLSGATASTTPKAFTREVHIANNGLTLLRGAHVISISGNVIRVGMTWNSLDFTWQIQTSYSTKFVNSEGEKMSANDIRIGDIVTVTGNLAQNGREPIVNADIVRK